MKLLIIRPLLSIINSKDRDYIKLTDIEQIENKINNDIKRKLNTPNQEKSTYTDKKYLECLSQLKQNFNKSGEKN